jgi:hypothetical protein
MLFAFVLLELFVPFLVEVLDHLGDGVALGLAFGLKLPVAVRAEEYREGFPAS